MIEQTHKSASEWIRDNVTKLATTDFKLALELAYLAGFTKGLAEATKIELGGRGNDS